VYTYKTEIKCWESTAGYARQSILECDHSQVKTKKCATVSVNIVIYINFHNRLGATSCAPSQPPLSVAEFRYRECIATAGPVYNSHGSCVDHDYGAEDAEDNIAHLPETSRGNGTVVEHRLVTVSISTLNDRIGRRNLQDKYKLVARKQSSLLWRRTCPDPPHRPMQ
jgi:hypothetical protein